MVTLPPSPFCCGGQAGSERNLAECRGLAPLARRHALVSTEARLARPVDIPNWSAWQDFHLHSRRFEIRAFALGYTRWCPRPELHQHFTRFKCAVSALDYVGEMVPREGFPPPNFSVLSGASLVVGLTRHEWHSQQDSHLQPRRSKRRALIL